MCGQESHKEDFCCSAQAQDSSAKWQRNGQPKPQPARTEETDAERVVCMRWGAKPKPWGSQSEAQEKASVP